MFEIVLFLCSNSLKDLEKKGEQGQFLNSETLSAKIIGPILYNDCTEVNRINQDYRTG